MTLQRPNRVAAIHDLSGFGRCSLTVILPLLSAMGVQACPIPTAVLSTHTGGLLDPVFRDLTDYIEPCLKHYQELGIDFECIYSGFLGSDEQIEHCLDFFKAYPNALAVVDPVMGDHGKAYRTCGQSIQDGMKRLVQVADIITPNVTECSILLSQDYSAQPLTHSQAKSMLVRLSEFGPKIVVITGAPLATGKIANLGYDREKNAFWSIECEYVPVSYPGTGDAFASILVGGLLTGDSLPMAIERATRFLEVAIKTTYSYSSDTRYGIMLEKVLPELMRNDILHGYNAF